MMAGFEVEMKSVNGILQSPVDVGKGGWSLKKGKDLMKLYSNKGWCIHESVISPIET